MSDLGMINRMPRLIAAQAAKANPFYESFKNGFKEKISVMHRTRWPTPFGSAIRSVTKKPSKRLWKRTELSNRRLKTS